MVVKLRPADAEHGIWQARTALPSSRMVQAPQTPTPQPNLVPVRPNVSRMIHNNGVSLSSSTTCFVPLIVRSVFCTKTRESFASGMPLHAGRRFIVVLRGLCAACTNSMPKTGPDGGILSFRLRYACITTDSDNLHRRDQH